MPYRYRVTLEPIGQEQVAPLVFEVENHDDIVGVFGKMEGQVELSRDERASLAVGLKLFSEVVLHHRTTAPFASIFAPLREFIGELKKSRRGDS